MADILCEVSSCYFWSKGDKCSADKIFVVNSSNASPSMEMGSIGNRNAQTSEETACKTFRPH